MKHNRTAVLSVLGLLVLPGVTQAQEAGAGSDQPGATAAQQPDLSMTTPASPGASAGDIIVTARKRQESIFNVPVVETALPAERLERRVTVDLKDLAKIVPGLQLASANGILGTQVSLRGVGTSAINVGIDASVSLNVDGLQITQGTAYASAIFDLGQVEVLKGPQSLFYGKNSPGGVIALHTNDPTDRTEITARYGHEFEADENRAELIVSGPVSDTLKLRLAGLYDHRGGFFHDNIVLPPNSGARVPNDRSLPHSTNYIVRGTALWTPSPDFTAKLKVNIAGQRTTGEYSQYKSCPDGTGRAPSGIVFLGGTEDCKLNRNTNVQFFNPAAFTGGLPDEGRQHLFSRLYYGTLELTYRPVPDISVTSVTGYFKIVSHSLGSGTASTYAGPGFVSIGTPLARRDVTQELRVNSDLSGPLNFTAGAYYQNGRLNNRVILPSNQFLNLDPVPTGPIIRLPAFLGNYQQIVDIDSISGFAQLRYKIVPELELAAGARFTHERRDLTAFNYASGSAVLFPTAVPRITSNNWSPEFTVTYRPTSDVTVFGSYKKAFKSGSFTLTALTTPNPDFSFGDERVSGFEAGVKSRFFDRSLATSIAFYDYKYKGLQVGAVTPATNGVPVNATLNAGAAKVYGIDFDATYQPPAIAGLALRGAVAWNHARFQQLDNVPCYGGQTIAAGCTENLNPRTGLYTGQNLAGQPLVRAPDWQATFGFDYSLPVKGDMRLIFSNENQYTSRNLVNLGLRSDFYQPSYFKSDLTATLQGPDDRWEVALVGKNIGNKLTTGNCATVNGENGGVLGGQVTGGTGRGPAGVDELTCYVDSGREVWLRLTVHLMR